MKQAKNLPGVEWTHMGRMRTGIASNYLDINELKPMIPSRCFEIATSPGDIVLDPFGGGGSSYEVAQTLHRYWLGTEVTTCEPIVARLKERFLDKVGQQPPADLFSVFR
jgi:site-specific DNA-methyltransferase (adenine-specific)